ncbi:MAG: branched-chain amino acid ABC transporter permease, partial [Pseudomonadota bacterium]
MRSFASRHPFWATVIAALVLILLWMIFAVWPAWLEDAIGRKKIFLNALFNGITLGGL